MRADCEGFQDAPQWIKAIDTIEVGTIDRYCQVMNGAFIIYCMPAKRRNALKYQGVNVTIKIDVGAFTPGFRCVYKNYTTCIFYELCVLTPNSPRRLQALSPLQDRSGNHNHNIL